MPKQLPRAIKAFDMSYNGRVLRFSAGAPIDLPDAAITQLVKQGLAEQDEKAGKKKAATKKTNDKKEAADD